MRELITELDEHFGIIADLDMLRREFYSMKQGTHETVSQFAGRVGYQLMELQTMFPGAIPQCDEEEIKKRRLYGGLKPHLKSAMTFCREMANEGKDLTYHVNFSKLPDILKQIMRIKSPQDAKKTGEKYITPLLNLGKTLAANQP